MSENNLWAWGWTTVSITIVLIVLIVHVSSVKDLNSYTTNGYCETQQLGSQYTLWTKCK